MCRFFRSRSVAILLEAAPGCDSATLPLSHDHFVERLRLFGREVDDVRTDPVGDRLLLEDEALPDDGRVALEGKRVSAHRLRIPRADHALDQARQEELVRDALGS